MIYSHSPPVAFLVELRTSRLATARHFFKLSAYWFWHHVLVHSDKIGRGYIVHVEKKCYSKNHPSASLVQVFVGFLLFAAYIHWASVVRVQVSTQSTAGHKHTRTHAHRSTHTQGIHSFTLNGWKYDPKAKDTQHFFAFLVAASSTWHV